MMAKRMPKIRAMPLPTPKSSSLKMNTSNHGLLAVERLTEVLGAELGDRVTIFLIFIPSLEE